MIRRTFQRKLILEWRLIVASLNSIIEFKRLIIESMDYYCIHCQSFIPIFLFFFFSIQISAFLQIHAWNSERVNSWLQILEARRMIMNLLTAASFSSCIETERTAISFYIHDMSDVSLSIHSSFYAFSIYNTFPPHPFSPTTAFQHIPNNQFVMISKRDTSAPFELHMYS